MDKLLEVILAAKPTITAEMLLGAKDLYGEGILDSLDIIVLVSELNAEYGLKIGVADFTRADFMTVDYILALVKRRGGRV